jgi:diacylglycerol kinase (ATP)
VVNPTAGQGKALKVWDKTASILKQSGQDFAFYLTEKQGDGTRMAGEAARAGAELIVGVGGDGTLNEIVNGLNFSDNILGIIPTGTGNGFRRSCSIPGNWQAALSGLSQWKPRYIDLGRVNDHYFLNVVGIGFDAAVEELASGKYHNLKGYLSYIPAFIEELATFKYFPAILCFEQTSHQEDKLLLIVINNGAYYGGSMCIAPQASVDDGKLDLTIIRRIGARETIILAVRALLKKQLTHKAISKETIRSIRIESDESVPIHIDGELIGKLPITIELKASTLKIMAPGG